MPHRTQEIVALCAECREPATDNCKRCSKPFCSQHKPGAEARCDACEGRFLETVPLYMPSKIVSAVSNTAMVAGLLATCGIAALVITQQIVAWSLVAVVMGLTGLYGLREILIGRQAGRQLVARKQFLLERPGDEAKQLPKRALVGPEDEDL